MLLKLLVSNASDLLMKVLLVLSRMVSSEKLIWTKNNTELYVLLTLVMPSYLSPSLSS